MCGENDTRIATCIVYPHVPALVQVREVTSSCNQQIAHAHAQILHEIRQHDAYAHVAAGSRKAPILEGGVSHDVNGSSASDATKARTCKKQQSRDAKEHDAKSQTTMHEKLNGAAPAAALCTAAGESNTEADEGCSNGASSCGCAPAGRAAQQCLRAELSTVYMLLCRGAIAQLHEQAQRGLLLPPSTLATLQQVSGLLHGGISSLIEAEVQYLERQLTKLNMLDGNDAPVDALSTDFDFACSC